MSKLRDIWLVITGELSTARCAHLYDRVVANGRGWAKANERVAQLEALHNPTFAAVDSAMVEEWAIEKMQLQGRIEWLEARLREVNNP